MTSLTFAIPDEFKSEMKKLSWVNWSELANKELVEELQRQEMLKEFKKIVSKSKFTEKDADELSNSFNISCRLSSSTSSLLANSDQFTQDSFFISDLNSSGIANVKDVIYLTSNYSNFLNCLTLDIIIFLNTSDHLTSGNLSIFSFTFSDIDKVIVAIFNLQPNYVYKRKYVDIYKTFDFKKNLLILSSKTLVFFILTYLMYNYYKKRRLRNLNK